EVQSLHKTQPALFGCLEFLRRNTGVVRGTQDLRALALHQHGEAQTSPIAGHENDGRWSERHNANSWSPVPVALARSPKAWGGREHRVDRLRDRRFGFGLGHRGRQGPGFGFLWDR